MVDRDLSLANYGTTVLVELRKRELNGASASSEHVDSRAECGILISSIEVCSKEEVFNSRGRESNETNVSEDALGLLASVN